MTTEQVTRINPEEVSAALRDCLYRTEELDGDKVPDDVVPIEGIMNKFGFHPERLEEHREEVVSWLRLLPKPFRAEEGGGWSFLQACMQEDGSQWGEHQNMDELFCLGMGLSLVECQVPRELWKDLPGGMPYYVMTLPQEPAP